MAKPSDAMNSLRAYVDDQRPSDMPDFHTRRDCSDLHGCGYGSAPLLDLSSIPPVSKLVSLVATALVVASTCVGCHSGSAAAPTSERPSTVGSQPVPTPHNAAQVVTKPGRYVVGEGIESGDWEGLARDATCSYAITRARDGRRQTSKMAPKGGYPTYNDDGTEIGVGLSIKFFRGDVLEVVQDPVMTDLDECLFWNEGTDAPAPLQDSSAPWDVTIPTGGTDVDGKGTDWKMGEFDYLDAVKQRVTNFDEGQLTQLGLWSCWVGSRGTVGLSLQRFAHLTEIQADYLITASYKFMCPENAH
jgi:hypothetical protein